jgi:Zn-dependent peptidase ImmA (M78 family)
MSRANERVIKQELSRLFGVSKKAVEIRLKDLGYIDPNAAFWRGIDVQGDDEV